MSDGSKLRRRELLLGTLGGSVIGCLPKWKPVFDNAGWFNNIHTRCILPDKDLSPSSLAEVVQHVKDAEQAHARVRAVGAGHSFSDISFSDGWLLRTLSMSKPIALPSERIKSKYRGDKLFLTEGGIRLADLCSVLEQKGWGLPTMGGWNRQTLAGVISTSTHGSGLGYGPFPSLVTSIVMVVAGGRVIQIEPTDGVTDPAAFGNAVLTPTGAQPGTLVQDDEAFNAAIVGMGSMGVIYSVMLRVDDAFWLHESREITKWETVIQSGGFLDVIVKTGAPPPSPDGTTPEYYELLLNPYATGCAHTCAITRRKRIPMPADRSFDCQNRPAIPNFFGSIEKVDPFLLPDIIHGDPEGAGNLLSTGVSGVKDDCYEDKSYNVFNSGSINELNAFSVELAVDLQQAVAAIERIFQLSDEKLKLRSGVHSAPISIRFVKASNALLSPQNGRATVMMEIFTLNGVLGTNALLLEHERDLMDRFGARPHWGLDLRAIEGYDRLKKLYPTTLDKWIGHYREHNASGVFNGELTDRLQISMPGTTASRRSYECIPLKTR